MIRERASLRISFSGGGADVAPLCEEQDGAIIGNTINKYMYCSIVPREDNQIIVNSIDFGMTIKYSTNENYVYNGKLDLVTAVLKAMGIKQGCEVFLQCDAPPGSSLGTSSMVMAAMLMAIPRWRGTMMNAYAMTGLACQVERLNLGIDGGYQDQYAISFDGFSFVEFHGRNNVVMNPPHIKKDIVHELRYSLLLCYMEKIHVSANIIRDRVQDYEKKDSFQAMCEVKALAYILKGELLKGNLHGFGKLLDYGWQNKKCMSSKITTPQINELYDGASKAEALDRKLLGAGRGGCLLIYCSRNMRHKVVARVGQAGSQLAD